MAYSNFTLDTVREAFQLEIVESAGAFSEASPVVPRAPLYRRVSGKGGVSHLQRYREGTLGTDRHRCTV